MLTKVYCDGYISDLYSFLGTALATLPGKQELHVLRWKAHITVTTHDHMSVNS